MDWFKSYGLLGLDIVVTGVLLLLVLNRVKSMQIKGVVKGLLVVTILWGVSRWIGLSGLQGILGTILQYALLGVIILFPNECKSMLARYGRRKWFLGADFLLDKGGRKEVIMAVSNLSKQKIGGLIVVAKNDGMNDVIATGKELDRVVVSHEVIESFFKDDRLNNGALIIKDNRIVSVNSQLPVVTNEQLDRAGAGIREYAGLGAVFGYGAVVLSIRSDTGKISIMGKLGKKLSVDLGFELKERNLQTGVSEDAMLKRLEGLLSGGKQEGKLEDLDKPKMKKKKGVSREGREIYRKEMRAGKGKKGKEIDEQKGNQVTSGNGFFG